MLADVVAVLESLTASPWFLPLVFAIAAADSVLPVVPSETAVIVGGVAAGFGELSLLAVMVAAATGAIAGDSLAYQLGLSTGRVIRRRGSERSLKRVERASRALRNRAGLFIVSARFIPGGRTAVTVASGISRLSRGRFTLFVVLAGLVWATYSALLGYVFGRRFQEDHTQAFLFAFGTALTLVAAAELLRWIWGRWTRGRTHKPGEHDEAGESVEVG